MKYKYEIQNIFCKPVAIHIELPSYICYINCNTDLQNQLGNLDN